MNTFDLSLAVATPPKSDVQASKDYTYKEDANTGEKTKDTVTDSAITIDKSSAPKIMLDGPLGHMYTQLLNKELSNESMGGVLLAGNGAVDGFGDDPGDVGVVTMTPNGAVTNTGDDNGYIYIVDGDALESGDFNSISDKLLTKKAENPDMPIGLATITRGNPSPTMESLTRCMHAAGVLTTTLESGITGIIRSMLKETK